MNLDANQQGAMSRTLDDNVEIIKRLSYSSSASPLYDLLCDAILWEDELPSGELAAIGFLRYIFNVRTHMANHNNDPIWKYFQRLVPLWPGFRPERCNYAKLRALYDAMHTEWILRD